MIVRRIGKVVRLKQELLRTRYASAEKVIRAWQQAINGKQRGVDWQFRIGDADKTEIGQSQTACATQHWRDSEAVVHQMFTNRVVTRNDTQARSI